MARFNREDARTVLPQLEKRIDGLLDFFYPVGTVYETLDGKFNPNKAWGGKWERIKGKTLVGVDEDDTDFVDGASGGAKGAWKHNHGYYFHHISTSALSSGNTRVINVAHSWSTTADIIENGSTNNTLNVDIANMPPYITVYMWRRTK